MMHTTRTPAHRAAIAIGFCAAAGALAAFSPRADAAMVQYNFVGYFTEVNDAGAQLPPVADPGVLFVMMVVVDTATPAEAIPVGFPVSFGTYYDAIHSWSFVTPLGALGPGDLPSASQEGVLVANDFSDGLGVTVGDINGLSLSVAFIGSPDVFATDALPTTPGAIDLTGALALVRLQLVGNGDSQFPEASATGALILVDVLEIPAPGAGALVLVGIAIAGTRRRR